MNPSTALIVSVVALTCAGFTNPAFASGDEMSRAELVSKSQLIVIGRLSDRREFDATWAISTLTIRETLKGDPQIKQITLKYLAKPGNTSTWTYNGDEDGIWFIAKNDDADKATWSTFYAGGRIPTTVPSEEGKKEIAAALSEVKALIAEQQKRDRK